MGIDILHLQQLVSEKLLCYLECLTFKIHKTDNYSKIIIKLLKLSLAKISANMPNCNGNPHIN